jgi:hypothetical protein
MEQQNNGNNHMPPLPRQTQTHDHKHDLLPQLAAPTTGESRKHGLPSPDPTVGLFDRLDRPFKLPLYPPPSYTQTHDTAISFSRSQDAELAPIKFTGDNNDDLKSQNTHKNNNQSLPSFSSIAASSAASSPSAQHYTPPSHRPPESVYSPPAPPPVTHWPSLNPLTAYYNPSHVQDPEPPMRMEVDTSSSSAASPDRFQDGRASSVSLDDPDVRMAAEALGDLRAGQFLLVY